MCKTCFFEVTIVLLLPKQFEDFLEKLVFVKGKELFWYSLWPTSLERDFVQVIKQIIMIDYFFICDVTEGKRPEKAIAVSSYLSVSVNPRVQIAP